MYVCILIRFVYPDGTVLVRPFLAGKTGAIDAVCDSTIAALH